MLPVVGPAADDGPGGGQEPSPFPTSGTGPASGAAAAGGAGQGAPAAPAAAAAAGPGRGSGGGASAAAAAPAPPAANDESETEETDELEDEDEDDATSDEDEDEDEDELEDDDDDEEEDDDDEDASWVGWFCALRGNEFFAEVDVDYLEDDFNLAGLAQQVPYYDYALDMLLDHPLPSDLVLTEQQSEALENAAERLYGLAHARFVVTARGLQAVMDKYRRCEFGRCPR
jgi:casein kinase II subunit beta